MRGVKLELEFYREDTRRTNKQQVFSITNDRYMLWAGPKRL